jgi:Holliday junction resolvase RusA-like endonuclease
MQSAMSEAGLEITTDHLHLDMLVCLADLRHGDADNYEKAVNDAAEGVIFKNDKQVVSASKKMVLCPDAPGVHVMYRSVELSTVSADEAETIFSEWIKQ